MSTIKARDLFLSAVLKLQQIDICTESSQILFDLSIDIFLMIKIKI
jgi:hypothetical protein